MFHLVFTICVLLCHTWTCAQGTSVSLVLPGGQLYVESLGSFEACVVLSDTNVTGSDVTVNLTTVDGTAQAPADYESVDESFTFSPTSNTTMCVNITINDDGFPEILIETLSILLTLDGVTADSATVTINDDDGATVSLSASIPINFTVIEGDLGNDTDLEFCVQLDDNGGGLERDIHLFIVPLNQNKVGSAESGDYQTSQFLTIPSLATVGNSVCHQITIIGDDIAEVDETLTIAISVANSNDVINGSDIITVTILDNDGASVFLVEPTSFSVTEEDSGSNTDEEFCVQIDRVLERDIPLSLSFGGSAGSGDFQINPTLTIPSSPTAHSVCHQITIIGDDIVEGDETLIITVSVANTNDVINGSDVVTVTILDNDEPVDCGTLMNPDNGQVNLTDTTLGANATYTCDEGFPLEGVDTRTCETDGEWSDSEPICGAEIAQISLLALTLLVIMELAIMGF